MSVTPGTGAGAVSLQSPRLSAGCCCPSSFPPSQYSHHGVSTVDIIPRFPLIRSLVTALAAFRFHTPWSSLPSLRSGTLLQVSWACARDETPRLPHSPGDSIHQSSVHLRNRLKTHFLLFFFFRIKNLKKEYKKGKNERVEALKGTMTSYLHGCLI